MAALRFRSQILVLAGALALAGCDRKPRDVEALDRDLIGNASAQTDPALTATLGDQIMVDPALTQQASNRKARPAVAPSPSPAERPAQHRRPSAAECYAALVYGHGWATKLPAGVLLYPDAAVDEAAGNDRPGCRTRVVSYASAAPARTLVVFYVAQARRAGWAAGQTQRDGDEIVAGERGGAAFYVAITPRPRGSAVNIVTRGG